jgi:hypothetical protein
VFASLTRRCRANTGASRMRRAPRHEVAAGPQAKLDIEASRGERPGQTKYITKRGTGKNVSVECRYNSKGENMELRELVWTL